MKANPKWTREQATAMVQQAVANRLFESYYKGLVEKFHLKKEAGNFAQAAQIHQRLLHQPVEKRGQGEFWITNNQVKNELTEQEKKLVLAALRRGQFTLKDWFLTVCNIAPPRRPQDLSTPAGVEQLLDRALRLPLLVAEAKARGYDKDEKLRSEIRRLEDQQLLYKVREVKIKGIPEPTADQIKAYYEKNQDRFAQAGHDEDQPDLVRKPGGGQEGQGRPGGRWRLRSRAEEPVRCKSKRMPQVVSSAGEGLFWAELWKAEPNQTVGPVRGFYGSGVKWRIVKVLEKTPAKVQPYSEQLANSVKWALIAEQQQQRPGRISERVAQEVPARDLRRPDQGSGPAGNRDQQRRQVSRRP